MSRRITLAAALLALAPWLLSGSSHARAEKLFAALSGSAELDASDSSSGPEIVRETGARWTAAPAAPSPVNGWLTDAASGYQRQEGETELAGRARVTQDLLGRFDRLGRPLSGAETRRLEDLRTLDGLLQRGMADKYGNDDDVRYETLQLLSPNGTARAGLDRWSRDAGTALYYDRYANPYWWGVNGGANSTDDRTDRMGGAYYRGLWTGLRDRMREKEIPHFSSLGRDELAGYFDQGFRRPAAESGRRWVRDSYRWNDAIQNEWANASFWSTDIIEYWKIRGNQSSIRPGGEAFRDRQAAENDFLDAVYGSH